MNELFDGKLQIVAQREIWNNAIGIGLAVKYPDGRRAIAEKLTLRDFKVGDPGEMFMSLGIHDAQALMDELWGCGLRPTEGTGSAGSLAATERHLADLQKLVFSNEPAK